jgi:hypothetical protein
MKLQREKSLGKSTGTHRNFSYSIRAILIQVFPYRKPLRTELITRPMKKLSLPFFVLAMALLPHLLQAQIISFQATLAGWEEHPPHVTPATG